MSKSGGFVGGLGGQMTLTLEDKCEAKVKSDLAKTEYDLLMIRVPSTMLIPCAYTVLKALIQGFTVDSEFLGR